MEKKGFTLAEVLITLGIIGVVAAMTLPALIQKYEKQVTVTRLKTTYSTLSQAIKMSESENGTIETWNMPNSGWGTETYTSGKEFAEKYILPYMKIVKKCEYRSNDCMASDAYDLDGSKSNYTTANINNTYNVALKNGVVAGFWTRGNLTEIYIDINGKQKPNTGGKDKFGLLLVKNPDLIKNSVFGKFSKPGLYFYGHGYDRDYLKTNGYPCAKTGTNTGGYCGALIMLDGWEIKNDYPW